MTAHMKPMSDSGIMRALVVDDEPPARRRLARLLEGIDGVSVVSQARSVEFIDNDLVLARDVDVIFLDINMPGQSGVDYAHSLGDSTPIVFVTAYSEHAVEAFGVSAVDYLLKPVQQERLLVSLDRVRSRIEFMHAARSPAAPELELLSDLVRYEDQKLALSVRGGLRLIEYAELVSILAQDDYTEVVLVDGSSELVAVTMKTWEHSLPKAQFMRVHRSAIISRQRLQRLERNGSRWHAWVDGHASPIPVSRSVAADIRSDLRNRLRVLG
jgi:two-component system, LytTR family, response regulator